MLDGVVVPGRQGLALRGAQVDEAWVERVQGLVRQREAATRCARCCDAQRQRARGCHAGAQAAECGSCAASGCGRRAGGALPGRTDGRRAALQCRRPYLNINESERGGRGWLALDGAGVGRAGQCTAGGCCISG